MAGIMKCQWCVASAVVLVLTVMPGCQRSPQVNRANYDKITTGMPRAEVEKLLGGPGEEDAESLSLAEGSSVAGAVGIGGDLQSMSQPKSKFKTYKWGTSSRWIKVTFLEDKVAPANFKQEQGLK
jgi:hypothetical protein